MTNASTAVHRSFHRRRTVLVSDPECYARCQAVSLKVQLFLALHLCTVFSVSLTFLTFPTLHHPRRGACANLTEGGRLARKSRALSAEMDVSGDQVHNEQRKEGRKVREREMREVY